MRSLKHTLIVWVAVSAVVLSVVAGVSLYLMTRSYLVTQFDGALARKARLLGSTIEIEIDVLELGFEDMDMSEFDSAESGGYLQVFYNGESLYRSGSLAGQDLPVEPVVEDPSAVGWVELPGGRVGRGIAYSLVPVMDLNDPDMLFEIELPGQDNTREIDWPDLDSQVKVLLCLARDADEINQPLYAFRIALIGVGLALALLMSAVIYLVIGRGLRPVAGLADSVGQIDERSLDLHLDPTGVPEELVPIVEQFNSLMSRLRTAFQRERSFSADMAHELRTPLAGLRTTIEVTLKKPRTPAEHEQCLNQLHDVTRQMQTLIEGLLELAALEAGNLKPQRETVDIDSQIGRLWQDITECEQEKVVRVDMSMLKGCRIHTDPRLLAVILRNVMHNAFIYVDSGGVVAVSSSCTDEHALIRVTNSGSRVPGDGVEKIFNRFWRADKARSDTGSRFGLGLSLTRLAVEALGGRVHAESELGGEFVIHITLPK